MHKDTGRAEEAEKAFRTALALQEKLVAENSGVPEYRQHLATSHNSLGAVLLNQGKKGMAETEFRIALGLREELANEFPAVPEYRQVLAHSHNNLGTLLWKMGKSRDGEKALRAALGLQEKLVADHPAVADYREDLGRSQLNLGSLFSESGKPAEAEAAMRAGLALFEKLTAEFPGVPGYRHSFGMGLYSLGVLFTRSAKMADAVTAFRQAAAHLDRLTTDYPAMPQYLLDAAKNHMNLAIALVPLGKTGEAEAPAQAAIKLGEKLAAESLPPPEALVVLGSSYNIAGMLRVMNNKPAESIDWFGKGIAVLTPVVAKDPLFPKARQALFVGHAFRAQSLADLGRHGEALPDWDKAVDLAPPTDRNSIRAVRVKSRIRADKVDEAVAEVAELAKFEGIPAGILYDFAAVYALASAKDKAKTDDYGQRAVALLRQAVQGGFKDVTRLKKDPDLDALRPREDFQMLLTELDKGKHPGP
jgi:tetratricopeptide (TPR) repeat protein